MYIFDDLKSIPTKNDAEPSRNQFKRTNRRRETAIFFFNIKIGSNGSGSVFQLPATGLLDWLPTWPTSSENEILK